MTQLTTIRTRIARRTTVGLASLLIVATGTVSAHGTASGSGMMGNGFWGLFGGAMGLWGLFWMGLILAIPIGLVYAIVGRGSAHGGDDPVELLRQRYARGELTDEEFQARKDRLEQSE